MTQQNISYEILGYSQTIAQLTQTLAVVNTENSILRSQIEELQLQLLNLTQPQEVPNESELNGD